MGGLHVFMPPSTAAFSAIIHRGSGGWASTMQGVLDGYGISRNLTSAKSMHNAGTNIVAHRYDLRTSIDPEVQIRGRIGQPICAATEWSRQRHLPIDIRQDLFHRGLQQRLHMNKDFTRMQGLRKRPKAIRQRLHKSHVARAEERPLVGTHAHAKLTQAAGSRACALRENAYGTMV